MTVTYTWDVFTTLDGFGSYHEPGDWGGYWSKEGPEFLEHRLDQYSEPRRMVLGGITFRAFLAMIGPTVMPDPDPVNAGMRNMPTTVLSGSLAGPQDWPDCTIETGDAVEAVSRLKSESAVPLVSHGSMSLNRTLMAAGLVDRVQVAIFPVISGRTGDDPVFAGAADFDLELLDSRLFDGRIQGLTYRPTLHRSTGATD